MRRREHQHRPSTPTGSGALRELETSESVPENPAPSPRAVPAQELLEPESARGREVTDEAEPLSLDGTDPLDVGVDDNVEVDVSRVDIAGVPFHRLTEEETVAHVLRELSRGRGGRIVTPNVDILRNLWDDPMARRLVVEAELVVPDGVPLLWLARWTQHVQLSRVTGADLIFLLSEAAASAGRSIFVLGGPPGAAERAGENLSARYPGLRVAGSCCPAVGFDEQERSLADVVAEVVRARPDVVFCGLGFPKQEKFAEQVRPRLPGAWFVGCGAAVLFASGDQSRAPLWMQRSGLEWTYRMAKEPRRLFKRYVVRDIPFLARVLVPHFVQQARTGAGRRERSGSTTS